MRELRGAIRKDAFELRGVSYSRATSTIAGLLAFDQSVKSLAITAGIDVRAFENIVGQVQQLILSQTNKPVTGLKVAQILQKVAGY